MFFLFALCVTNLLHVSHYITRVKIASANETTSLNLSGQEKKDMKGNGTLLTHLKHGLALALYRCDKSCLHKSLLGFLILLSK
jgi:hypothetical protein